LKNQNDKKGVLNIIEKSSNIINLIIIPLAFYLIVFSNDVIKILFERGNFTSAQTNITANIMRCYAIGLLGYGFQDVFTRALHAYKIVKCTIKASIVMVIINIILDFLFFKSIGSYGIALASSLAILCVIPMLSRDVIRYIGEFSIKLIVSEIIKIVAASVVATISVIFIKKLLIDNFMTFIILSILYIIIYFIICIILKVNIFKEILKNRMEF
jgi:putative peptidoglycan lipid II flippase